MREVSHSVSPWICWQTYSSSGKPGIHCILRTGPGTSQGPCPEGAPPGWKRKPPRPTEDLSLHSVVIIEQNYYCSHKVQYVPNFPFSSPNLDLSRPLCENNAPHNKLICRADSKYVLAEESKSKTSEGEDVVDLSKRPCTIFTSTSTLFYFNFGLFWLFFFEFWSFFSPFLSGNYRLSLNSRYWLHDSCVFFFFFFPSSLN